MSREGGPAEESRAPAGATGETRRPRPVLLAVRVLMLLLAAGAAVGAFAIARAPARARDDGGRYVCPMHPEVTGASPGVCPICRMELEPVGGDTTRPDAINPSAFQTYDFVRLRGFGQGVRAPAWVDEDGSVIALLYDDETGAVDPEDRGSFSPSAAPRTLVPVRRDAQAPEPWDGSTSRMRFRASGDAVPRPGEVGWVRLPAKRRELEVIPKSAVLESEEGPYVLVSSPTGQLTRRAVRIGRILGDYAIVLSGLRLQERVSVRSAPLLDAEMRLRRATSLEMVP